jgi:hypothetical protein
MLGIKKSHFFFSFFGYGLFILYTLHYSLLVLLVDFLLQLRAFTFTGKIRNGSICLLLCWDQDRWDLGVFEPGHIRMKIQ